MNLLKRLFTKDKVQVSNDNGWTMFSTSKEEVKELLIDLGQVIIRQDEIQITNYSFEPSIAFRQIVFKASAITNIDLDSYPITVLIDNDLLFVTVEKKEELKKFVVENKIETIKRQDLWSWILEPFLDTEFTDKDNQRTKDNLYKYGLTVENIFDLRKEVEIQMLKYNFDTMLWDWTSLGASDVLRAMRTRYNIQEFRVFYRKVINISLLVEIKK